MNTSISETKAIPRLGNRITVLIPAFKYSLSCAWTKERPLPAVELFSCRLLLIFEKLLPGEIQDFFGLNDREREELVHSLQEKRLATLDQQGFMIPTPLLLSQSGQNGKAPMLVEYTEQTENVVFDVFTLSVRKEKALSPNMFGLPELSILEQYRKRNTSEITEAFGRQFRSYLEISKTQDHEKKRTQLYKIMGCQKYGILQLPVDIEFTYQATEHGEPKKWTSSYEHKTLQRPLSNELESHIADYLGGLVLNEKGIDAEEYCRLVDDSVLIKFTNGYRLDYSSWLVAREERKTGYGSPDTTALFGPVYLFDNRKTVLKKIRQELLEKGGHEELRAIWLSSDVPLWAASSDALSTFSEDLTSLLEKSTEQSSFTMIHQGCNFDDARASQKHYKSNIPYGVMTPNDLDRMEIFIIPGIFAFVQYHGQPNIDSAVTLPIGYMTVNQERLNLVESLIKERLGAVENLQMSWPSSGKDVFGLIPSNWKKFGRESISTSNKTPSRAILRLKK
ncbi:hypothetical protein ACNFJN_15475 [Xenorhabdus budapestensis]|uniref:hypothetical protein n=1 Tax=Xenorhabdus budapestensis TaxID=290110 RepID=UPI003A8B0C06